MSKLNSFLYYIQRRLSKKILLCFITGIFLSTHLIVACTKQNAFTTSHEATTLEHQTVTPFISNQLLARETPTPFSTQLPPKATFIKLRTDESEPNKTPTIELNSKFLEQQLIDNVNWYVFVKNLNTNQVLFCKNIDEPFNPASMIKIPLAMAVLKIQNDLGKTVDDLNNTIIYARDFNKLMYDLIVLSEEPVADTFEYYASNNNQLSIILNDWGLQNTNFNPRTSTITDLAKILEGLYDHSLIGPEMSQYLIDLMFEETLDDNEYLGIMIETLPGAMLANKRGLIGSPVFVGDLGLLNYQDETWLIIIAGDSYLEDFKRIKGSLEAFSTALAEQIDEQQQNKP